MAEYIDREAVREMIKNYGKVAISDGRKTLDPVDDIISLTNAVDLIPATELKTIAALTSHVLEESAAD